MSLLEEVQQVKSVHKAVLLSRPNVVGVGVGFKTSRGRVTDELSVVVMVRQKLSPVSLSNADIVPREVDGIRTDVVEVGELRPLIDHTGRFRPAPGGVSLGHYQITAGTLGCVVHDRSSGARLILSNNHVIANRNSAHPGDPILQPGPADGGTLERDVIALLERFEPIRYNQEPPACGAAQAYARLGNLIARFVGSRHQLQVIRSNPQASNLIDAALARPIQDSELSDEILEIGTVSGLLEAELGMQVSKSGRTTGLTTGTINILDATATVNYGNGRTASFEQQIVTTPMSEGGDSGSLLIASESKQAVGLLFAGSSQATLHNPIQQVLSTLNVSLICEQPKSLPDRRAAVEKAQAVKQAYTEELMSKPYVVGVGLGLHRAEGQRTDQIGLVVMVSQKVPDALLAPEDRIPAEIEGVPVDVREVGEFKAQ